MTSAERKPKTKAERNRDWRARAKAGRIITRTEHDALWLAEMLAAGGFRHPDEDRRDALTAALQKIIDVLIEEIKPRA
jgi:hypothetical protein